MYEDSSTPLILSCGVAGGHVDVCCRIFISFAHFSCSRISLRVQSNLNIYIRDELTLRGICQKSISHV